MYLIILRIIFAVIGGGIGYYAVSYFGENYLKGNFLLVGEIGGFILFGIVSYFVAGFAGRRIVSNIRAAGERARKIPGSNLVVGVVGLFAGLVIGSLISIALRFLPFLGSFLPIIVVIIFSYIGIIVALNNKSVVVSLLGLRRTDRRLHDQLEFPFDGNGKYYKIARPKILDTSCIIDGRISEIVGTGFLEGKFIIPNFIVGELQEIADSEDSIKRVRGRSGLDALQKIQGSKKVDVEILEKDYPDLKSVDSKIIKLARELKGVILTTDLNLCKVARLKGVDVLNINDLSTALKMMVLPGEKLNVEIVKEGKEKDQGVAYLSDGTMIVVEGGKSLVGREIEVLITGVLQTPAGRMVFSKISSDND
ncbi:MAG: TRAM domain-containing protein [Actinobacteria bacterium]|nr:TRAM domain-containing protein [Actinomycetota bacterium]